MRRKSSVLAAVAALVMGGLLFLTPAVSYAVIIVDGTTVFSGGVSYTLWDAGTPVTLGAGQNLILIQTASGNFDTSDNCGPGTLASCTGIGAPTVKVNGQTFTDGTPTSNVLGFNYSGGNPVSIESHEWKSLGLSSGGDFEVFVGYADNSHTGLPCPDAGANCQPDAPSIGSATTIGSLGSIYDTGAVLIVGREIPKVPEPATLLLLGAGLVALGAWARRRSASKV